MNKVGLLVVSLAVLLCLQDSVESRPQYYLLISGHRANWNDAVLYCNAMGMRLAVIDSQAKEMQLQQTIRAAGIYSERDYSVWIGASDQACEGQFLWYDGGKQVTYSNWAPGQPDNAEGLEHCVEFVYYKNSMKWMWNDYFCTRERYFACDKWA